MPEMLIDFWTTQMMFSTMATVTSVHLPGYRNRNVAWNIYSIVKHRIKNCDRVVRQDKKTITLTVFNV